MVFGDALCEELDQSLKDLGRINLHDLGTRDLSQFLIILGEGEQSFAEGEDRAGSLCLHLVVDLGDHQVAKDRHEDAVEFDLHVWAQLLREGGNCAKGGVSDSLVLVSHADCGSLHNLLDCLSECFFACLSN